MSQPSTYDTCKSCGGQRWAAHLPPESRGVILNALQTHERVMIERGHDLAADITQRVHAGIIANERFSLAIADGLGPDVFKRRPAPQWANRAARRARRR